VDIPPVSTSDDFSISADSSCVAKSMAAFPEFIATGNAMFPIGVSPKYSGESAGKARMHTCLDQYNANKATNANGGLKWIERGGGYYSACNKR
jgi:hypothetical protein